MQAYPRTSQASANLIAALDSRYAPRTKVLAVIRQQTIPVFAQAGLGALERCLSRVRGVGLQAHGDAPLPRETMQCDVFDGPALTETMKASVVNHAAVARIDTVVRITFSLADQMGAHRDTACRPFPLARSSEPIEMQCIHGKSPMSKTPNTAARAKRVPPRHGPSGSMIDLSSDSIESVGSATALPCPNRRGKTVEAVDTGANTHRFHARTNRCRPALAPTTPSGKGDRVRGPSRS